MRKIIHSLLTTPPKDIPGKTFKAIGRKVQSVFHRGRNRFLPSYSASPFMPGDSPHICFKMPDVDLLKPGTEQINALTGKYLSHSFDLLGSGWVQVKHGITCRGLEGNSFPAQTPVKPDSNGQWLAGRINGSNLSHSQKIWSMVDPGYTPIDWHLDFISGYRWSEDAWYFDIPYGHLPGVDIKAPWELARMQHLPQFAWAYELAKDGRKEFAKPDVYSREFRNQVLDFIATNPPRYGVNWRCAMDVGIRAANWLTAYDFFKSAGAAFDDEFENQFVCSIYDHGLHIIGNLEWVNSGTSNHYLANIAGLLFVSAHLPQTEETDSWLAFSTRELIAETKNQFNAEGTNREGSTCYHRLSSEMIAYPAALILGLPEERIQALKDILPGKIKIPRRPPPSPIAFYPLQGKSRSTPFPPWFFERLERMSVFTAAIAKPDGSIPQIGDNDSGRFLKLCPSFKKMRIQEIKANYRNLENHQDLPGESDYWMEDHLDHSRLTAGIDALYQKGEPNSWGDSLEADIIKSLAGGMPLTSVLTRQNSLNASPVRVGSREALNYWLGKLGTLAPNQKVTHNIRAKRANLLEGLTALAFPKFGLYCYRSPAMYLAVRCGRLNDKAPSGHFHNDQLSIELNLEGKDIIRDPGSYLYTPLPHRRNEYRSVKAHYAPRLGDIEPNRVGPLLFHLEDKAKAQCLYFGPDGFLGTHSGYGPPIYRMILIKENELLIHDFTEAQESVISDPPGQRSGVPPFSSGYGMVFKS